MSTSMSGYRGPTGLNPGSTATGNQIPKGYQYGQLQQFTPEQMQLFSQLFSHVGPGSFLSRLSSGDESLFQDIERPALRQFGELQGNIASRFSGMGAGARRSSGFQNTQSAAASQLAQDLQAQRLGLQRQALQDLMGMSSSLLGQRPYENFLVEKPQSRSFLEELFLGTAPGIAGGASQAGSLAFLRKLGLI